LVSGGGYQAQHLKVDGPGHSLLGKRQSQPDNLELGGVIEHDLNILDKLAASASKLGAYAVSIATIAMREEATLHVVRGIWAEA
jgi:hypothetical protein